MNKNTIIALIIGLVIGGLVIWLLTSFGVNLGGTYLTGTKTTSTTTATPTDPSKIQITKGDGSKTTLATLLAAPINVSTIVPGKEAENDRAYKVDVDNYYMDGTHTKTISKGSVVLSLSNPQALIQTLKQNGYTLYQNFPTMGLPPGGGLALEKPAGTANCWCQEDGGEWWPDPDNPGQWIWIKNCVPKDDCWGCGATGPSEACYCFPLTCSKAPPK